MLKSHKLLAGWAVAVVVSVFAGAAVTQLALPGSDALTRVASGLTGSWSAHAESEQPASFPESQEHTTEEAEALETFRQQRSALVGEPPLEKVRESSMTLASGILIALLVAAFLIIGVLLRILPAGTIPSLLGKKRNAIQRGESGRVAASRLVGRSDADLNDGALESLQTELADDTAATAREVDAPQMPRVSRVVMPTPEAVSRSLVPPGIRRPSGMASAAASALRQQAHNRVEPGSGKVDDLTLQRRGLGDRADRMFRELQRYYGFGSRSQLQGLLTNELFAEIEGNLAGQDGSGIPQVLGLVHEVVSVVEEGENYVGVVAYQATLKFEGSPPEKSNELFRFVKSKAKGTQYWKLAHIEQRSVQEKEAA